MIAQWRFQSTWSKISFPQKYVVWKMFIGIYFHNFKQFNYQPIIGKISACHSSQWKLSSRHISILSIQTVLNRYRFSISIGDTNNSGNQEMLWATFHHGSFDCRKESNKKKVTEKSNRKKSNRKESNSGEVEKITGKKICKIDWIKYMYRF